MQEILPLQASSPKLSRASDSDVIPGRLALWPCQLAFSISPLQGSLWCLPVTLALVESPASSPLSEFAEWPLNFTAVCV